MSKDLPQVHEQFSTRVEDQVQEPKMYKVLLHNDNYTTMDFVIQVLERVFSKTPSEATQIMLNVHKQGLGVCGVFTAEIAETKVAMVNHLSQQRGFPLKCSMEEA
jgi:ATP-dependent Clp protease adaptor protein ClpS